MISTSKHHSCWVFIQWRHKREGESNGCFTVFLRILSKTIRLLPRNLHFWGSPSPHPSRPFHSFGPIGRPTSVAKIRQLPPLSPPSSNGCSIRPISKGRVTTHSRNGVNTNQYLYYAFYASCLHEELLFRLASSWVCLRLRECVDEDILRRCII